MKEIQMLGGMDLNKE